MSIPSAVASLPVMLRYVPGASLAGATRYVSWKSSVVSPKAYPALSARRLASAIIGRAPNFSSIQASVVSMVRP